MVSVARRWRSATAALPPPPLLLLVLLVLLCLLASSGSVCVSGRSDDATAVVGHEKAGQIQFWEREASALRQGEMAAAFKKLYMAQAALEAARRKEGFFYTNEKDRATIRLLDEDYRRTLVEVNALKEQERLIVAKLKPLYGVVSVHFAQEQKTTISNSIKTVQSLSYDNAWFSSLTRLGEAETFTDVIVGFVGSWVLGFLFLYPFALLYYALWAAPWSVYEYSAGVTDLVPGIAAYVVCVGVMCLPLLCLGFSGYLLLRHYGPRLMEAQQQRRQARHPHQD
ncbi:hypothetical protein NESM_000716400 [Novymonas esmeraldas]|uniref:Uncharacterized protein n=1 Tax=Novymonas esmeraldas TaxID=1808958 RepID=A0AAW0EV93_9TRYP